MPSKNRLIFLAPSSRDNNSCFPNWLIADSYTDSWMRSGWNQLWGDVFLVLGRVRPRGMGLCTFVSSVQSLSRIQLGQWKGQTSQQCCKHTLDYIFTCVDILFLCVHTSVGWQSSCIANNRMCVDSHPSHAFFPVMPSALSSILHPWHFGTSAAFWHYKAKELWFRPQFEPGVKELVMACPKGRACPSSTWPKGWSGAWVTRSIVCKTDGLPRGNQGGWGPLTRIVSWMLIIIRCCLHVLNK